jgi:hypothetical protein
MTNGIWREKLVPFRESLVPNLLNYFEFSNGYGEADSWFESFSLRHELNILTYVAF